VNFFVNLVILTEEACGSTAFERRHRGR